MNIVIETREKVKAGDWQVAILGTYRKVATAQQIQLAIDVQNNDAYNAPRYVTPVGPSFAELDAALAALTFAPTVKPLGLIMDCLGRDTTTRNPAFIAAVLLPLGKQAWQVGPRGPIYADIAHAVRYATFIAFDRRKAA